MLLRQQVVGTRMANLFSVHHALNAARMATSFCKTNVAANQTIHRLGSLLISFRVAMAVIWSRVPRR